MKNLKWTTISIPLAAGMDAQLGELSVPYGKSLFIGRLLREDGLSGWQAATTAALLATWDLAPSPVFFDVGANIGIYAALHGRLRPDGTTVAFEPTPDVADAGESFQAANDLKVRWERAAVSDTAGEATLYLSARTDASNSLVSRHREPKGTVTVPAITLDSYVRSSGLVPSVVKIDVERHEPAVIRGAAELLDTHRPVIVAELLPGRSESDEVQHLLAAHGYEARHIEPPEAQAGDEPERDWLFWPGTIPAELDDRFREWYSAVATCVPAEVASTP
ncbi:FkbM family methyltransferase [Haloactinopolyspora alba]|uniref:FkbM family methyltransferase n=1 Tax=Haloactinopolyspora alba TaxID=648780 RepID=A0A2P8DT53_9ACTN|nr:FkbM family methyltransferase [Haloactinopolyspora alba]PSL00392.1 FkbM family methyltransferase [Haloactinopolyspora alba]